MLKKVDQSEFEKLPHLSINLNPSYLNATAASAKLNTAFFIYYTNNKPSIAFGLLQSARKIILPKQNVFYSGIWINFNKSDNEFNEDFFNAINDLKKFYESIKIVLPPSIVDLRPFLWNGFLAETRYTYLKPTNEQLYKQNINRQYKKAKEKYNLTVDFCSYKDIDWNRHKLLLISIHLNGTRINQIEDWLKLLDKKGLLLCMGIYCDTQVVGSVIVLVDQLQSVGYLLYLESDKSAIQSEINAVLYIEVQKELLRLNIKTFDYLGANIPSIANYKSRFNPVLKPYYIVTYKKKYFNFQPLKNIIKRYFNTYLIR